MQALFDRAAPEAAILVAVILEAVALTLLYRRTGHGIPPRLLLPNLAAGASLTAAAALAARAAWWPWIAAALLAALATHLADLGTRWR